MDILQLIKNEPKTIPAYYRQMSQEQLEQKIREIKGVFGNKLFIPGHHYQRDEVIQFADVSGDSLQLAQIAAKNRDAQYIVFCGVHFMAETADILTKDHQTVILPDMRAGCSMADMADIEQTERAWEHLQRLYADSILPLTYVNSTAAIKAFVGKNGGATVTSSNAEKMVKWALSLKERILFLPDQHLGRNTAFKLGIKLEEMAVWDPHEEQLLFEGDDIKKVKVILWKGHCSVHENFTVENISEVRHKEPTMKVIVHPECQHEVVRLADESGSTNYIIKTIEKAEKGSSWAIGTEMNLVNRLIKQHPDKKIISLNPHMCPCLTMNRIDLPHLAWALDAIKNDQPHNVIHIDDDTASKAKLALSRMLERT
ncbi:quinolinate synthase NadA [Bacillus aquiflavi]|uniref:Quinolinate synthase n=1 Tax=Bacillus aquiflavi TaxID=2672567 RepID=A0A6B3VTY9_9BACI|nr:quinolinate synthase NadA [Bacillus aquiflavi]MBA4537181.1 quinolinate synthase NadA [Bacillus aquiflavi]NEY81439.1 quinolinate synthase NadA [Bacillus aquiflavi]